MSDVEHLAKVLEDADRARSAEVAALADMADDEVAYLAGVGLLEDPVTDGIEPGCAV